MQTVSEKEQILEDRYRRLLMEGGSPEALIEHMHLGGLTIIGTIKLVRKILAVDLGAAKNLVVSHDSWKGIAEKTGISDEDIDEILGKLDNG